MSGRDAAGVPVAASLGSNRGDRVAHLATGVREVADLLLRTRCSRVYETEPEAPEDGGLFLNMCCVGTTDMDVGDLIGRLLAIEERAGRARGGEQGRGPRRLDVDLLLYGGEVVDRPAVRVPHPRMRERPFVLVPLAEIAAGCRDPVTGSTVAELAEAVGASGVRPYRGELPEAVEARIRR